MRATSLTLALAAGTTALGLAAVSVVMAPTASAQSSGREQSPSWEITVPGQGRHTISPDLLPLPEEIELPPLDQLSASRDDQLAAAALSADYLGETGIRDSALAAMSEGPAAEVRTALSIIDAGVPSPADVPVDSPITVLGNGLNEDGTVHPNLASRLEVAHELAVTRPGAPVIVSGGQTEWGPVESHAMRDWLITHELPAGRITTEEQSWATVSNAWHTSTLIPEAESVIVVTSENHLQRAVVDFQLALGADVTVAGAASRNIPAAQPDAAIVERSTYRDALLWYLLPGSIIADGLPPYFGPGISRFWED